LIFPAGFELLIIFITVAKVGCVAFWLVLLALIPSTILASEPAFHLNVLTTFKFVSKLINSLIVHDIFKDVFAA
jgi:hypothetical protein